MLAGKQILIAEDNEINQKVLSGLLEGSGIVLVMVENGKEVIEQLHKNPNFDLILMDISMPVMDGYEAAKLIRKYREYDNIPIVALTANAMKEEISHVMSCGMQGYIGKPLNVEFLYTKLLELLGDHPQSAEPKSNEKPSLPVVLREQPSSVLNALVVEEGIERCGGDKELYKALLQDFQEMYNDSVAVLENIYIEKRFDNGKKFAHDIKGVSANIGAYRLSESALALEEAFVRKSQSNYALLIKNYHEQLKRVLMEISDYM